MTRIFRLAPLLVLAAGTPTGCVPHCALDERDPACQPCQESPNFPDDRGTPLTPSEVRGWGEKPTRAFVQWAPDDAEIFYIALDRTSVKGVRVADGQRRTLATGRSFGAIRTVPVTGALYAATPGSADPLVELFSNRPLALGPGFGSCGPSCTYDPPQFVVSPDGQRIAFLSQSAMSLYDLKSGSVSALSCSPEGSDYAEAVFSPSSGELLCRPVDAAQPGHVVLDLATGASQPVAPFPQRFWIIWNAQGVQFLHWDLPGDFPTHQFTLTNVSSGANQRVPAHDSAGWLDLTSDGRTLAQLETITCVVAGARDSSGGCTCAKWGRKIWVSDFQTGEDHVIASAVTTNMYPPSAVFSNDGRRLAYEIEGSLYVRPVR